MLHAGEQLDLGVREPEVRRLLPVQEMGLAADHAQLATDVASSIAVRLAQLFVERFPRLHGLVGGVVRPACEIVGVHLPGEPLGEGEPDHRLRIADPIEERERNDPGSLILRPLIEQRAEPRSGISANHDASPLAALPSEPEGRIESERDVIKAHIRGVPRLLEELAELELRLPHCDHNGPQGTRLLDPWMLEQQRTNASLGVLVDEGDRERPVAFQAVLAPGERDLDDQGRAEPSEADDNHMGALGRALHGERMIDQHRSGAILEHVEDVEPEGSRLGRRDLRAAKELTQHGVEDVDHTRQGAAPPPVPGELTGGGRHGGVRPVLTTDRDQPRGAFDAGSAQHLWVGGVAHEHSGAGALRGPDPLAFRVDLDDHYMIASTPQRARQP